MTIWENFSELLEKEVQFTEAWSGLGFLLGHSYSKGTEPNTLEKRSQAPTTQHPTISSALAVPRPSASHLF
jgi:hypothetical protein